MPVRSILKRIISMVLSTTLIFGILGINFFNVQAENSIGVKIGDYIQFGKYNNESILWMVLNVDENGFLLFSEKILCQKVFDAPRVKSENANVAKYGSSYWVNSNLRNWLNSEEQNINWLENIPNYSDEAGFLSSNNFTEYEKSIINPYMHKVMLSKDDTKYANGGNKNIIYSDLHTASLPIEQVPENYNEYYFQNAIDKAFLLDASQIKRLLYNKGIDITGNYTSNNRILKSSYFISSPVVQEHTMPIISEDNNIVLNASCNSCYGVRPALYINPKSDSIIKGDGNTQNPYIIEEKMGETVANTTDSVEGIFTPSLTDRWTDSGNYNKSWLGNNYSQQKEWKISNAADLAAFAAAVNSGKNFWNKTIMLTKSINLYGHRWDPINNFSGMFDGNGFEITNMTIDIETDTFVYAGMFGRLGEIGKIRNLRLGDGCSISVNNRGELGTNVGGIAGYLYLDCLVENCYSSCTISVNGNGENIVGGIIGNNFGGRTTTNCQNVGDITVVGSGKNFVGGLIGQTKQALKNCSNKGNVYCKNTSDTYESRNYVGGIVAGASLQDCYNTGEVKAEGGYNSIIGGLTSSGSTEDCYNTGTVLLIDTKSDSYIGGLIGQNSITPTENVIVNNCYNTGNVYANKVWGGQAGGIVGQSGGCVQNSFNNGEISAEGTDSGFTVGGVVGGNYGVLKKCYNTGAVFGVSVGGVAGYNASKQKIQNCYNSGYVKTKGEDDYIHIGGIVGRNDSIVQNCYNIGNVAVEDIGRDRNDVGGIVGFNYGGLVQNSYSTGTFNPQGKSNLGGVVGFNYTGKVQNSYWSEESTNFGVGYGEGDNSNGVNVITFNGDNLKTDISIGDYAGKSFLSALNAGIETDDLCWYVDSDINNNNPIFVDSVIYVNLNNNKIKFDVVPIIKNDRTLVPMRAIFEALGANVSWNDSTKTVTATKDSLVVNFTIENNTMIKNGQDIVLDVAPVVIGGRTLVPVRAVAEAFGAKVEWNDNEKTVVIKTN